MTNILFSYQSTHGHLYSPTPASCRKTGNTDRFFQTLAKCKVDREKKLRWQEKSGICTVFVSVKANLVWWATCRTAPAMLWPSLDSSGQQSSSKFAMPRHLQKSGMVKVSTETDKDENHSKSVSTWLIGEQTSSSEEERAVMPIKILHGCDTRVPWVPIVEIIQPLSFLPVPKTAHTQGIQFKYNSLCFSMHS